MNRYSLPTSTLGIALSSPPRNNDSLNSPIGRNVKYPEIGLDFLDVYVYTNRGDRYDTLANIYYNDASLWWIISRANSFNVPDSLIPPIGTQVRIPHKSRIADILSAFKNLNI